MPRVNTDDVVESEDTWGAEFDGEAEAFTLPNPGWSPMPVRRSWLELEADPDTGPELVAVYRAGKCGGRPFKYHPMNNPGAEPWLAVMSKMVADNDPAELAENAHNLEQYRAWQGRHGKADDDALDDSEFEGGDLYPPHELSKLEELNARYIAVAEGGRLLIVYIEDDAEQPGIKRFRTLSVRDFKDLYANTRIERDPDAAGLSRHAAETVALGQAWLEWPDRRTAYGWTFDHKAEPATVVGTGYNARVNRWCGWRIVPAEVKPGQKPPDWSPIERMIRESLCAGNDANFNYLIRWIAYRFQNPHVRMGTCITIKGEEGVGKGVLGNLIAYLCGSHGATLSDPEKIVGRFSGHLVMKIFVFLDEALRPEIPKHEARLKQIVTEPTIEYEAKFKDVTDGVNRLGLMQATNSDYAVRASKTARRYFVLKASSVQRVDRSGDAEFDDDNTGRKAYWRDLVDFIYNRGGAAAFLHAMLTLPLGDWEPMGSMVETAELAVDKRRNFSGQDLWMDTALTSGTIPGAKDGHDPAWDASERMRLQDLVNHCNRWLEARRSKIRTTQKALAPLIQQAGWHPKRGRARLWACPSLEDARTKFANVRLHGENPYAEDPEAS